MADKKITQLDAVTTVANTDLLLIVRDPSTVPVNKKLTVGDLFGNTAQTVISSMNVGVPSTGAARLGADTIILDSRTTMTVNSGITINNSASSNNTVIKSTSNPYMFVVASSNNQIGINTNAPTSMLDINGDSIRIRSTRTPANSNNTIIGQPVGTISWNNSYLYLAANSSYIARVALSNTAW
jgi:hypothetical protein